LLRVRNIGFCNAQNRLYPGIICGNDGSINKTCARLRIRSSNHNDQLVRIGHHHTFGCICVIGTAAQYRRTLSQTNDAR
jgi:uroporphyrinogen-III decarboxylase